MLEQAVGVPGCFIAFGSQFFRSHEKEKATQPTGRTAFLLQRMFLFPSAGRLQHRFAFLLRQLAGCVFFHRIVGQAHLRPFGVHPPQRRIFLAKHLLQLFVGGCFLSGLPPLPELMDRKKRDIMEKRCREKGPAEEHLTDRELKQKIQSVDRRRAKFYELYTGSPWRNMENFDVCVNTTHVSVRAWVPFLASLVESEK